MSTAKRVYFYLVYFITLGMFSGGVGILLHICFDLIAQSAPAQVGAQVFAKEMLSLGLAMVVIGGVLWFLFWRAIRRNVAENPAETGSAIRKLFLNLILAASALAGFFAAVNFLQWLMAGPSLARFPSTGLTNLIVTGVIWYYHWRLTEGEGQPSPEAKTLRRWYVYFLSGWGLVSLAITLVQLVNTAVLYLPVWGTATISGTFWNSSIQSNLSWILLGGAVWFFHWFRMARGDSDSTLRQVYLYLLAILGGLIAGLVALGMSLFKIFSFAFSGAGSSGNTYFQFLGWTVPTMLVAATAWVYHTRVTQEEAAQVQQRLSARRVHSYLTSFLGLGALTGGLILLLGILLELLLQAVGTKTVAVTPAWWHDQLSACLALLVVATPIWLYYWNRVLRMVAEGGMTERRARARRIFLYAVVGVAIIVLATDLVYIVYQLLNGLLQGTFGVNVLRHSKWNLQSLLVAIPVLWYHWRILREDQRLGAEKLPRRKTVTLLASEAAVELVSRIEAKLGSRIRLLRNLGQLPEDMPVLSDEDIDRLVSDVQEAPSDKVLLIATENKVMVVPYQEK